MVMVASCLHTARSSWHEPEIMSQLPKQQPESKEYWVGTSLGELRYQLCCSCQVAQFPPSTGCRSCGSNQVVWRASSGLGTIFSITTVFRPPSQDFKDKTPYDLALVELDEGFRIMVNVTPATKGQIGSRIKIIFEKKSDEISLPQATLLSKQSV